MLVVICYCVYFPFHHLLSESDVSLLSICTQKQTPIKDKQLKQHSDRNMKVRQKKKGHVIKVKVKKKK